jgi:hypothetical protein
VAAARGVAEAAGAVDRFAAKETAVVLLHFSNTSSRRSGHPSHRGARWRRPAQEEEAAAHPAVPALLRSLSRASEDARELQRSSELHLDRRRCRPPSARKQIVAALHSATPRATTPALHLLRLPVSRIASCTALEMFMSCAAGPQQIKPLLTCVQQVIARGSPRKAEERSAPRSASAHGHRREDDIRQL